VLRSLASPSARALDVELLSLAITDPGRECPGLLLPLWQLLSLQEMNENEPDPPAAAANAPAMLTDAPPTELTPPHMLLLRLQGTCSNPSALASTVATSAEPAMLNSCCSMLTGSTPEPELPAAPAGSCMDARADPMHAFCMFTYSNRLLHPELGVRAKLSPSDGMLLLLQPCAPAGMWKGRLGRPAAAAEAGLPLGLPDGDRAAGATCSINRR
jgi:hypothetical protein